MIFKYFDFKDINNFINIKINNLLMAKRDDINKYAFLVILLALIVTVFFIIKPLIVPILTSFVLVYIFYPVYKRLNNKIKKKNVSAIIVSLLIILVFSVPSVLIVNTLVEEVHLGNVALKKVMSKGDIFSIECNVSQRETALCRFSSSINEILSDQKVKSYVDKISITATNYATERFSKLIISIPQLILNIFIIIFLTYYLFKDGKSFFYNAIDFLPLKKKDQKDVIKTFNDVIYATLYGQIITAIIQGTLAGIGFYIFGVSSPVFWGSIMMILSLIPFVGSSIIWAPASIYMFISGFVVSDGSLVFKGAGLFIYGLLIVSTIDNILRPKIVGDRMGMHPALVFLGVIGGMFLLGILGILLGPLFIAILIIFARIYKKREFL